MKPVILFLTCADKEEAETITESLLEKKLIACAKTIPVSSSFLWKSGQDSAKELLLIMDSIEEKFESVEREVLRLHSYETPNLIAVPVVKASKGVKKWLKSALK